MQLQVYLDTGKFNPRKQNGEVSFFIVSMALYHFKLKKRCTITCMSSAKNATNAVAGALKQKRLTHVSEITRHCIISIEEKFFLSAITRLNSAKNPNTL